MSEKQKLILSSIVLLVSVLIGSLLYFKVSSRIPFIAFILIVPSLTIALVSYKIEHEIEIVSTLLSVVGVLYFLLTLPSKGAIANMSIENSTNIVIFLGAFFLLFNIYYMFTKSDD